jgi:probable phosphomutase (TIGR03848 family)
MSSVFLIRHGRTTANVQGILAGRMRGVGLDNVGNRQAKTAARHLRNIPLEVVITSPLLRTVQTAKVITASQHAGVRIRQDKAFGECDYGTWTGRSLKELAQDSRWQTVQVQPSAMVFPGGESLGDMQKRAVDAIRAYANKYECCAVVSHGDVIKAILADALGMHLDLFQRIVVDPGSISVISYTSLRPMVSAVNITNSLKGIATTSGQAVVGGRSR